MSDPGSSRRRFERAAAWSGPALVTVFGLGFLLGGFIPPPGADSTPGQIASFWAEDTDRRRLALVLLMTGGALNIAFAAAIAGRIRRIDGIGPTASYVQLAGGITAAAALFVFCPLLLAALLVPDLPGEILQIASAATWVALVGLWQPGALQAASLAAAVLNDRAEHPEFPRWLGWFSAWMAFGSLLGSLVPFFVSGPFAYTGFLGFFVAAIPFFSWLLVMCHQMLKEDGR